MSSINGFGTTFYGECDYQPDGSFVTTYWIILAFLPIIPLYSARIFYSESGLFNTQYQYEKLPVNWQQVVRIWAFVIGTAAGFIGCLHIISSVLASDDHRSATILLVYLTAAALLPHFLRYQAKKQVNFLPDVAIRSSFSKRHFWLLAMLAVAVICLIVYLQTL